MRDEIAATGVPVVFHNVNAADEGKRHGVIEATKTLFDERRAQGKDPFVAVLLHSLAFGTTLSYVSGEPDEREVSQKQLEMTADVMAHSLVYWTRDLFHAGLLANGSRIFAMTSRGRASRGLDLRPGFGREGRPGGARPTARAGADQRTASPSTRSAPASPTHPRCAAFRATKSCAALPRQRNPGGRLTRPEDVGEALVALASPRLYWMTGNTHRRRRWRDDGLAQRRLTSEARRLGQKTVSQSSLMLTTVHPKRSARSSARSAPLV